MLHYKSIPFECKADVDTRRFKGYASVFNVVDSYGDLIPKGAFTRTIKKKFADLPEGKSKIKALWLHRDPIGMPDVIKEDDKGLYVEAKVSKTAKGDEALELIRDGVVDEMSIGYTPEEVTYIERDEDGQYPEGLRRILKIVDLFEFSPVVWGANDQTHVEAAGRDGFSFASFQYALETGRLAEADVERVYELLKSKRTPLNQPPQQGDAELPTKSLMQSAIAGIRELTRSLEQR